MRIGVARAIVNGAIVDGDVEVEDGRIARVGLTGPAASGTAAPGFVDIQVNGFAGIDFAAAEPDDYEAVGAALATTGVTAYQPTLITLPEAKAVRALQALGAHRPSRPGARAVGMHLEGPFLSPERAGAHDACSIVVPDRELAQRLLEAGPVTMMTIAPERPEALDLLDFLVRRNVVVSCGHSNATAPEAHAAFDRGATAVTHLFSAQRPFHHRDPGIAGAALSRDDVAVSIILDGFHLAVETVRLIRAAPAPVVLITDAMAAAGCPNGTYPLGDRTVTVAEGSARLADGTLAGSVLTMDQAVRNYVEAGAELTEAVAAATSTPARVLGRSDLGSITPGAPADLVLLSDDLKVERTLVGGSEVFSTR